MTAPPAALLIEVLRDPGRVRTLAPSGWELLLRQAASAELHGSLPFLLEDAGLLDSVPAAPREHLEWMRTVVQRHHASVRNEVRQIAIAMRGLGLPLVLLKGAAYVMTDMPAARGRLFSDIDILVPKEALDGVEDALMQHGWAATHHDAYDQRYYREWMHELPPMEHVRRGTAIDVHHAIVPETAAQRPDPASLRAGAVAMAWPGEAEGPGALAMLGPHDMVLHSAVHLFSDGEFTHGLRDLLDLHRLLAHFGAHAGFWDGLAARARELELGRPLFYALRYASRLLETPVPPSVLRDAAAGAPMRPLLDGMDALFLRGLAPHHASCASPASGIAHGMLYLRGNWLRMPPHLLARHLFHKAFISGRPPVKAAD